MIPPLFNARTLPISVAIRPMPTATSTLLGWMTDLGLTKVVKKVVGARTVEVIEPIAGRGTWQPLKGSQLEIKPEGERSWDWVEIHISPNVLLETDDIISRRGVQYRVMQLFGYDDNGLRIYHLVTGYQGKGGGQ